MTREQTKRGRYGVLGFVVFTIIGLRLYWLPGLDFNARNWDDEIVWISDSKSRSTLEYAFYRDAPGYFVFIPRLLIFLGNYNDEVFSISSLRIIVMLIQLVCIAFAVSCVVSWGSKWKLWLLLFTTLSLTFVEDLNYIHNVGYLFVFPIYFLIFKRFSDNRSIPVPHALLACVLISKPFTSIIVLSLVIFFLFFDRSLNKSLVLLGSYSLFYLLCYLLLPHRWETPFNSDPFTLVKVVVGFPWIVFATIFPALIIGGMKGIRIFDSPEMQIMLGLIFNIAAITLTYIFRVNLFQSIKSLTLNAKGLSIVFILNYVLVFSASDSFWVKHFPIYMMDSPQFLWLRWSAILPFAFMLIIGSMNNFPDVLKRNIYLSVSAQWLVLILGGSSWLGRYW